MIIATHVFRLGIDEPYIQYVIYVRTIYQLYSFRQESGRAGRDGLNSQSIVMILKGLPESLQKVQLPVISRVKGSQ